VYHADANVQNSILKARWVLQFSVFKKEIANNQCVSRTL
jgi:hypothetical protein